MSLLSRSALSVMLGPGRLVVEQKDLVLEDPTPEAAVAALGRALAARRAKRTEVSVVLADAFVRYALLPWSPKLKTGAQWDALARHRLAVLHGAEAAGWAVRVSATAKRGSRIVAAVEQKLLVSLGEAVKNNNAHLFSVQPALMAAFNRVRKTRGPFWLVVEDAGRLTLALLERGEWAAVRSRAAGETWRARLAELLERESLLVGRDAAAVPALVFTEGRIEPDGKRRFRTLSYRGLAAAGAR